MYFDKSKMCPLGPRHFVRTGALAANLDVKTYDAGSMFLFTNDGSAASSGKLWVDYDIELINPQLSAIGDFTPKFQHISYIGATTSTPIGTSSLNQQNSDPIATASQVSGVLTFQQAGNYYVTWCANAATSITAPSITGSASCILNTSNVFSNTTAVNQSSQGNSLSPSTAFMLTRQVTVTSGGGVLTFAGTIVGNSAGDILITGVKANQT